MIYLYHYFEKQKGPFLNLSDLPILDAQKIQNELKNANKVFAAKRNEGYIERRRYLEQLVRQLFIDKGGKPIRLSPHYMVIGECPWLASWYEDGDYIKIPISEFDLRTVSFTYGDTFPTFSPKLTDNYEYRNTVYLYDEILKLIDKYGLPQDKWQEPIFAQPCYVEAQVWSDEPINKYIHCP